MNSFTLLSFTLGVTMAAMQGTAQETLDRTKRPEPQKTPTLTLPTIQKTMLSNGLHLWLVEDHRLPTVALSLVVQTGADHDPLDFPGIATMTADLLDEGTPTMDALQIADRLEFIGAGLNIRASFDGTFVNLGTLTRHMGEAIDVFANVISSPTFPEKEFGRIKQQRLAALLQQKDRASTVASLAFAHIIYSPGHPYGNDPSGTEKSLNLMTREDLVQFYSTYYRPNNSTLIVVGDVTLAEIRDRLDKALAQWKPATIPDIRLATTPPPQQRRIYLIDKPGAPQSEIRIGYPALARSTPDFFPVLVMNRLLGGQYSSRLNLNLREKRGYTYGARSSFTFNRQPGPFTAGGGLVSTKTDSSVREFLYEIDRMYREGVTAEELEFSKKGLTGSFALTFETPMQIAGALQSIALYNLPDDYYTTYLQNIERVTLDDVRRVSKRYLDSSTMAIVIVGDARLIRPGLEKLKVGEIIPCNAEGNRLVE